MSDPSRVVVVPHKSRGSNSGYGIIIRQIEGGWAMRCITPCCGELAVYTGARTECSDCGASLEEFDHSTPATLSTNLFLTDYSEGAITSILNQWVARILGTPGKNTKVIISGL